MTLNNPTRFTSQKIYHGVKFVLILVFCVILEKKGREMTVKHKLLTVIWNINLVKEQTYRIKNWVANLTQILPIAIFE